jgi:hypothetical protein
MANSLKVNSSSQFSVVILTIPISIIEKFLRKIVLAADRFHLLVPLFYT